VLLSRLDANHPANAVLEELISQVETGPTPETGTEKEPDRPRYVLATVEQVGPGGKGEDGQVQPMDLQPGDIVLVDGFAFDDPQSNFALVSEGSIKATVKEQQEQPQVPPGAPGQVPPGMPAMPQPQPQVPGGM
jgi:co-chaperonin GroES (HSP10)